MVVPTTAPHTDPIARTEPVFDTLPVDLLVHRAGEAPDRPAYTHLVDGEREGITLTYGDLDRRARSIAAVLRDAGAAGERVVVMVADEIGFIESFFGILYAGAVAVPTYPPLRSNHVQRSRGVIVDSGARFLLAPAKTIDMFAATTDAHFADHLRVIAWEDLSGPGGDEPPTSVPPGAPCFLQYTSGSTGTPKGVIVTHGNIAANVSMIAAALNLGADDPVASWNPLFHDMGLMTGVFFPLYTGGRAYLMSPTAFVQRPQRLLRAVARYRAALITGPNFSYQMLVDSVSQDGRDELDLSSLRVALNGAEPVRRATLEAFEETFTPCGLRPGTIMPAYGLAEATVYVSGGPAGRSWRSHVERDLVGHGTGAAGQVLRVVSLETGEHCPAGVSGEIWIAGPHVTPGYWNPPDPDDTFGTLLEDGVPVRFLRTGDAGHLDENGELYITGRIKDLIIVRGRNYSPADLERVAEDAAHPIRVSGAAAFAVEEPGDDRVVIVLEVRSAGVSNATGVTQRVVRAVGRETGVVVSEVVLSSTRLPRTTSGKIQRHRARADYVHSTRSQDGGQQ
ncbi:fatty acyl-AMP ligase [Nakamurella deserti]|uniref:fatty acyl-AMP ligase n=1 Tax=Nakamurella deserti TaxID=2164074 RepID=UPI000DBE974E|nr:fatty acyl-AMP ligase [Nakamurella deserti]